ncbi:hypothetical protein MNBD_GAMMA10-2199 [hydrothermal vent metagenome]|uniref:Uncharacterized protein n=1 Tax=hydrothermal vent metagenome TaxID=652676 RepID=A0A3B0XJ99_9ZZZZ
MFVLPRLNQIRTPLTALLLLITSFTVALSYAGSNTSAHIPQDLKPWEAWVLKDNPSVQCPITYNNNENFCAYPDTLSIDMKARTGSFKQVWTVYATSWITLPGDHTMWPKNVRIGQQTASVVSRNKLPAVQLQKGRYTISGDFNWQEKPKSLAIPETTGLIKLNIENKAIKLPDFRNGRLWLKTATQKTHQNNKLSLLIYRKITDAIPLEITTQIKLDVSGQQREITLEGALLNGFIPGSISSQLPAQIDKKGRLKLQIRPGQWSVNISAFNAQLLNSISLPKFSPPWPENEIWVLEQQPHLRLIKVTNKNSIDPEQTQLPSRWKAFPAYNLQASEQLDFEVLKRGDPEPEPDQLSLSRKIWLDFNGQGFTVNDQITGTLSRQWRLNASGIDLGQVTLNGKPQFITENKTGQQGVEVRHGQLNLSADSRIEGSLRSLSATGWDMDFSTAKASLYLPAGWRLMSLSGANADDTWLAQWSLLDLFIVLITSIAIYKLFGLKWGAVALITLSLAWHEYDAPQYIWLNLIIALALLRVLPQGRLQTLVRNYRLAVSALLIIIILPFMVQQVRTALHPQLEFYNMSAESSRFGLMEMSAEPVQMPAMSSPQPEDATNVLNSQNAEAQGMENFPREQQSPRKRARSFTYNAPKYPAKKASTRKKLASIDPDAMIQTGPGLPAWTLHPYALYWDGPVQKSQQISMLLLSPAMLAAFKVIQLIFILLLTWRLLDIPSFKLPSLPTKPTSNGSEKSADASSKNNTPSNSASQLSVVALLTGLLFNILPSPAQAAFPTQAMLDELREELTQPAQCLPQCASIETMSINLSAQQLSITLKIHAQRDTLLPLPVPIKQWIPEKISINGETTSGLIRKDDSTLWLHSPEGTHRISITGRVAHLSLLQFSFPLKPHYIDVSNEGWTAEGLDKQAHKITAITFNRIVDKSATSSPDSNENNSENSAEQSEIPVYAELSRTIELGLDWQINTHIRGISGSAYPVILTIPLLKGESVITDNIKVKDHHAVITLNNPRSSVSWTSKLENNKQIDLHASKQGHFIERWSLNASPIWHISYDGTPVIYHQRRGNNWQPEWQPWPGESLSIVISRPKGVAGRTLTIDNSNLAFTPGEQVTAVELSFNLRSSLGGQHIIKLPAGADLQSVKINNQNVPIRNMPEGLSLPISPGKQRVEIQWREARGISSQYTTSEIDLGVDSVNNQIRITPGYARWVLFVSGPTMGPAVLFWGVLIVILIISGALGRIKNTPVNTLQWLLLGAGLSASGPWGLLVIALCIFALSARGRLNTRALSWSLFNLMQVALVLLVFVSATTLLFVIQQGLLGSPDMQITGNDSSAYQLNWFSDRIEALTPQATIISVPVYIYRLLMLAWSIWLAFSVIKWAQWGWSNYTHTEYWRNKPPFKPKKAKTKTERDDTQ